MLGSANHALVVSRFGDSVDILTDQKDLLRAFTRKKLDNIVAGDRVVWQEDASGMVITKLLSRQNVLTRPDIYKKEKTIAANIEQIFVVTSVVPEVHEHWLDRYLVAAENLGVEVGIVLNKSDLPAFSEAKEILRLYENIGYKVFYTSAESKLGIKALQVAMANKTNIFIGQSGVGKSSILNCLLGDQVAETNIISHSNKRGQHTTTTARLYQLGSGFIIDSPGIREFGLWDLPASERLRGFVEFRPFIGKCKFRNCSHKGDPGCALEAAVAVGKISQERWQSFWRMCADLAKP